MKNLKNQRIWVCWKYAQKNGRRTKQPFSVSGKPTGTSVHHQGEWVDYANAREAARTLGFDGIGFVMPEGYFLLDVDHRGADDPLLNTIRGMLPSYAETSPSGHGYHIYGKVDLDRIPKEWDENARRWKLDGRYLVKNSTMGLELYIGGLTNRFATYTGKVLDGAGVYEAPVEIITDCTDGVLAFLDNYMKKPDPKTELPKLDTEKFIVMTEDDIPDILDELRNQKNGTKFSALFDDGDISSYGSPSEADAALCAMIAFRTGPNAPLIDAIFRESALYREKWDRPDYAASTIRAGIAACHGNFHTDVKVRPPFVINTKKGDEVNATLLADYVRKHLPYVFVREAERGAYSKYVYHDGVYQVYSDDMFKGAIKAFVTEYNPMLLKMSVIEETFKQLTTDLNYILKTALNADEHLINFQNGLLDIRDLSLHPHSPSVFSTIRIPCDWQDKPNPTPVFDSYLTTLTGGNAGTRALLLEFMGACLSNVPGHRMKKALFLHGPGDSGKSQLKRLTEMLLGDGNYTGIDLRQMEARFGTSSIYGRRLAGASDMTFITIDELNTFKKATGGDTLFAEFKGQVGFEFVYAGLLWFCTNQLPKFGGDDGKWVYERIMPVHCPNVIPSEKQDHELLDKMYRERAGIVYKAVMAIRNVIDRGYRFTEPDSVKEERKDYNIENNTALEFMKLCMKPRSRLPKNDDPYTVTRIYHGYSHWYDMNYGKQYRKSKKEFFRSIADSLGTTYEEMTMQNAKGTILKGYAPNADAWEEYDLSGYLGGDIRKWGE